MHASLEKVFNEIESQRESVLASFRSMTVEQLNKVPDPGSWSAAEVLSHVLAAERLSVAYMKKKAQGIQHSARSGVWEEFKMRMLMVSQRLPGLKFKAPKRVVENTTRLTSLDEIDNTWKEIRSELRHLLDSIPTEHLDRLIYKHPAAGYLNVRHALIFFREHLHHHGPQLLRLRKH